MRGVFILSGLGALLVLTVVAASAVIRLGGAELGDGVAVARGVHRAAASLAALLVLGLFFSALRKKTLRGTAFLAFALTLALSVVGWITGTNPPAAAALFNQLGGIALAALLAWLSGRAIPANAGIRTERPLALAALLFAALQAAFGGTLATLAPDAPVPLLLGHAVSGLAAAATVAALGLRFAAAGLARTGLALAACAVLAPAAGALSVLPAGIFALQAGHALAAALLLAAAAHAQARTVASA